MSRALIRGSSQILGESIFDAQIAAAAAIQTSKLAEGAEFVKRDGSVALTGNLDAGGQRLTNLANGTGNNDAVTLQQLEAVAAGYDPKESVRVASTADIDLATGGLISVDGVTVADGDRVLVKDQTDATENGIYTAAAGAWVRSEDMDGTPAAEVSGGAHTYVEAGSTNAGVGYAIIWDGIVTLGTDPVNWSQQSGAGSFTAGAGLTQTGNVLDVNVGDGIQIVGDDVSVQLDGSTLAVSAAGIKLADLTDGQILVGNGSNIATGVAVSGDVTMDNAGVVTIANGAITDAKISGTANIATSKLADGALFIKSDGTVAFGADQSHGGFKITNLGDGTLATDAATVGQVNSANTALQAELDGTQAGAGLSDVDGSYTADATTNYIKGTDFDAQLYTHNLFNADKLLDAAIKQVADDLAALGGGSLTAIQQELENIEDSFGTIVSTDNTWVGFTGTNYLDAATSLAGALSVLDTQAFTNAQAIASSNTDISNLQAEVDATQTSIGLSDTVLPAWLTNNFVGGATSIVAAINNMDANILTALDAKLDDTQLIDDDTMASATATTVSSSESVKAYVDSQISSETVGFVDEEEPTGAIDGANTTFTVAGTPLADSVKLYFNGQRLREGATNDFTIAGSTITTLFAPEAGDQLWVDYRI